MARPSMTGGEPDHGAGLAATPRRGGLHTDVGRVVVVHAAKNASTPVIDLVREISSDSRAVSVGKAMLDALISMDPDVVVVDHTSMSFDIVRVCRDISDTMSARIFVLADGASADDAVQVAALDAGADDFLAGSVSPALLMARLRAAVRGNRTSDRPSTRLAVGDVVIDLDAHALHIDGSLVHCPPLQFMLLVALAKAPNRVLDRGKLLATVWGTPPGSVDPRRIRIAISVLRRILGSGPDRPQIETVSHVGYRLVTAPSGSNAA